MQEPLPVFSPSPAARNWFHAVTGIAEISLVMGISIAAAMMASQFTGLDMGAALRLGSEEDADFLAASAAIGSQLAIQYGVLFALIALIGWFRGRRSLQSYAIAPSAAKAPPALRYGIFIGILGGVIPSLVFVLQDIAPIGQDTPIWAALRGVEWDMSFWLFMAIGSFAVIPLVEEGAWRGYILGRLGEGFAPGAAVLMTTALFALLHIQYLRPDAAMMLTFAGLVLGSLAFGFATLRTGSLLPAIVAHAIINTPMTTELHIVRIVLALVLVIIYRKALHREFSFWGTMLLRWSTLAVIPAITAIGGLVFYAMSTPAQLPLIAGGLGVVVLVSLLAKRSAWANGSKGKSNGLNRIDR